MNLLEQKLQGIVTLACSFIICSTRYAFLGTMSWHSLHLNHLSLMASAWCRLLTWFTSASSLSQILVQKLHGRPLFSWFTLRWCLNILGVGLRVSQNWHLCHMTSSADGWRLFMWLWYNAVVLNDDEHSWHLLLKKLICFISSECLLKCFVLKAQKLQELHLIPFVCPHWCETSWSSLGR